MGPTSCGSLLRARCIEAAMDVSLVPRPGALPGGLCVLLLALSGCGTTILPPPQLYDPATVYVVDQGRTPILVVPDGDGSLIRYAYGEWRWYALNETGPLRAVAALLWPTRGALGRAVLPGEPTLATVQRELPWAVEILPVTVEQALVEQFTGRMERQYQEALHTEVHAPHVRMYFVHHPRRYTWFWNSNHAVASWLREIGCKTRGLSYRSQWSVEEPARQSSGSHSGLQPSGG